MNLREELGVTRREFIKTAVVVSAAVTTSGNLTAAERVNHEKGPWHRRTLRWGQTNITEIDPARYDIAWWRQHWKRTHVQGVIINAGGIFAYYPSKFPLHHRPEALGNRDLYGELAEAAHNDGLAVLARMDSNRAAEDFFGAHSDWFTRDASGQPYRAGDRYVTCINSPYYDEYIPSVLREIIERSHPEGITDNSWAGLGRGSFCYCDHCTKKFQARTGEPIPREKNWDSPLYREWIQWNYQRRIEVWDLNNRVTIEAGGPDCLWLGMNSGSISGQSSSFRDYKEICRRTKVIMLDHQARHDSGGFQDNGLAGKLIHGLLGWEKLIPESMAMYQAGRPTFRVSSKPEPEARMWMLDGFAGGLQPWWHHVSAYHEDRRMYRTAEPILRWHRANEEFLVERQPVATVGVLWSQQNADFYGRDSADELVDLPIRGFSNALIRARIPFLPVHIDHLDRDAAMLSVVILPNFGALSDEQAAAIRRFVERGGSLIATGEAGLFNQWGEPRPDFALADLFGVHLPESGRGGTAERRRGYGNTYHTYLRLNPELRGRVYGPKTGGEPAITRERHPALRGFDETDILPFGGTLQDLTTDPGAEVLMTFVPPFPVYPPETAWMRQPKTDLPGLVVRTAKNGGRIAFMPADLDRRFGRDNLPDHANVLANLARWAANGKIPLSVEGAGLVDCHLYRKNSRTILHLVNLTSASTWRAPVHELISVGPLKVRVQLPDRIRPRKIQLLVAGKSSALEVKNGWAQFEVSSVLDHEVVVL